VRRFAKLRLNYKLLFRAGVWIVAVRLGLSTLPFRAVRQMTMYRVTATGSEYSVEEIVWAIRAVSRYVPKATCLVQALVVQRFLMASGHRCRLRLGVAKDVVRGFQSHAWVESGDRVAIGEFRGESVTSLFIPIAAWER
jgi:hypothetical protein